MADRIRWEVRDAIDDAILQVPPHGGYNSREPITEIDRDWAELKQRLGDTAEAVVSWCIWAGSDKDRLGALELQQPWDEILTASVKALAENESPDVRVFRWRSAVAPQILDRRSLIYRSATPTDEGGYLLAL